MKFSLFSSSLTLLASFAGCLALKPGPLDENPLRNFQVTPPLALPEGPGVRKCTIPLVHHNFAFSFGLPAVVDYTPPTACGRPGAWSAITLNFTATSNGTQFDRLSSVYLNAVEIWRTSTPEPTSLGIIWTALKDVSHYTALFSRPGTLVLDLANLLDASLGLTGEYDVRLSATFYPSSATHRPHIGADLIFPLSKGNATGASLFSVPPQAATVLTLPCNTAQMFVEIYASGDQSEEFWYGNVPDEFFSQLPPWNAPDGQANGHGPFREVQLSIDGILAGIVFPYPVIYTGEFLPSIWRPMVSYGAFDSPTYYVDVSAFIPKLSDRLPHVFALDVVGIGANRTINSDWLMSGNVQIVLDASKKPTTGRTTRYDVEPFAQVMVTGRVSGSAPDVTATTRAARSLRIEGEVLTGSGRIVHYRWQQQASFTNTETYVSNPSTGLITQHVQQKSAGVSAGSLNGVNTVTDVFEYPLELTLTYNVLPSPDSQTFYDYGVNLDHSYNRELLSPMKEHALRIDTQQKCNGTQVVPTRGERDFTDWTHFGDLHIGNPGTWEALRAAGGGCHLREFDRRSAFFEPVERLV
ncbi:hypothetical protein AURDEDRAFT_183127 [Auricularia subglabra TFB-10046 SS5]|nr:hypothetical protein AURDEDRAFT_183127 [Auricularia subglabra TFB-10046 SS5]